MKNGTDKMGSTVIFRLSTDPGCEVFVAGSFNDWNPRQHQLRDNPDEGDYKLTLTLPPGRHEYKFIVNGAWHIDLACPNWVPNQVGSLNSVIVV
ncbi:MAG: glycogen-binding domain-containing protein [Kiritimatiellae bacterium]|nr:glycogen-binding domain-containing protein [Kiritimatiellia bacterium]